MITRVYINCLSNISDVDQQTLRIVYIEVTTLLNNSSILGEILHNSADKSHYYCASEELLRNIDFVRFLCRTF